MAIPQGYRLLTSADVGKTFGVDLEPNVKIDTSVIPTNYTTEGVYLLASTESADNSAVFSGGMDGGLAITLTPESNGSVVAFYDVDGWKSDVLLLIEQRSFNNLKIHNPSDYELVNLISFNNWLYIKDKSTTPTLMGEITRIQNAKSAIKTAIEGKGVTVPDTTLLDGYPALIDTIQTGDIPFNIAYGEIAPTDTTKLWLKQQDRANKVVVTKNEPNFILNENINVEIATLSTTRGTTNVAAVGTDIYIFGGGSNIIQKYDTLTKERTTMSATLTNAVSYISVAAVGTDIYIFGGMSSASGLSYYSTIQKYNTLTDEITIMPTSFNGGIAYTSAAAVGTDIYIFGGYRVVDATMYSFSIQKYDTVNNSLETVGSTSVLDMTSATAVGTDIYVFGGSRRDSSDRTVPVNIINKYNTLTNEWITLPAKFNTALYGTSAVTVGTNIYIFGGVRKEDTSSTTIRKYDTNFIYKYQTSTGEITELNIVLNDEVSFTGSAAAGNNVYIFGGGNNTIQRLESKTPLPYNNLILFEHNDGREVNLIDSNSAIIPVIVNKAYIGDVDDTVIYADAYIYEGETWMNVNTQYTVQNNEYGETAIITSYTTESNEFGETAIID